MTGTSSSALPAKREPVVGVNRCKGRSELPPRAFSVNKYSRGRAAVIQVSGRIMILQQGWYRVKSATSLIGGVFFYGYF